MADEDEAPGEDAMSPDVKSKGAFRSYFSQFSGLPKAVTFVIIYTYSTVFSYNGMRAILFFYATNYLLLSFQDATALFHIVSFLGFLTPLVGALITDSGVSKHTTILVFTIVFTLEISTLAVTAIFPPSALGTFTVLGFMGIASGCIKPCIVALGVDQMASVEEDLFESFSLYYLCANLVSLSMFMTPMIRAKVTCFGTECYALAFGILAFVAIANTVFLCIRKSALSDLKSADNITAEFFRCCIVLVKNFISNRGNEGLPRKALIEYGREDYYDKFLYAVIQIKRIAILFIPFPIFFALFNQLCSRWLIQGSELDGHLFGSFVLQPDQMITFNLLFVILFIPLFDLLIYPIYAQYRISHLKRRMTAGFFLAAAAFFMVYWIQVCIERKRVPPIPPDQVIIRVAPMNMCPTVINISSSFQYKLLKNESQIFSYKLFFKVKAPVDTIYVDLIQRSCNNSRNFTVYRTFKGTFKVLNGSSYTLVTWAGSSSGHATLLENQKTPSKKRGKSLLRVIIFQKQQKLGKNEVDLKAKSSFGNGLTFPIAPIDVTLSNLYVSDYMECNRGYYQLEAMYNKTKIQFFLLKGKNLTEAEAKLQKKNETMLINTTDTINIRSNEIGTIMLYRLNYKWCMYYSVERRGSTISILWQIAPFFVMAIAEILFVISGYSFVYLESPPGTEAVVSALFFLTIALGDLIVIIMAGIYDFKLSVEFLIFAISGVVGTLIFCILSFFYKQFGVDVTLLPESPEAKSPDRKYLPD